MPSSSALARLQQVTTLSLLVGATAWLTWYWGRSPFIALGGFVAIAMGYSLFLAFEFVALRFVAQDGTTPRPGWGDIARAWLGETLTAPRVFCWRQPFRWQAVPDHTTGSTASGRRGVVFIHGFVCNRGFWTPWLQELAREGRAFVAVNLEPVFGSIDDYAPLIDEAVATVTAATGLAPVLVCHSMGGLAARAWMRVAGATDRVHHVVTIGSPHRGTWLGQFSHLKNGRQMRLGSRWLRDLEAGATPGNGTMFTCWYSNCDNVVFPARTATLPGADNRLVLGVAHVDLAFHPDVMAHTLARIRSGG
jgi:pimeloyl-ACP methyl ester carboxylesterase